MKAKLKAASYHGNTESPRGLQFGIGTCLNPYCRLNLFPEWGLDASGETEYAKSDKNEFIAYYDLYYAPINNQAPDMSIPRSGRSSQSKLLYSSRHKAVIRNEALAYLGSELKWPSQTLRLLIPHVRPALLGFFTRQIY